MGLQQQMKLAPRIIQAMEILQLPMLALQERIDAEMEANPVLETLQADTDGENSPIDIETADRGEQDMVVNDDTGNSDDFERLADFTDEYGVEHHMQSNLAGESWQRGPVILSWDETEFAGAIDGSNLVIHEFAHKLDMQNGVANGYPPLHSNMNSRKWVKAFSDGFEKIQQQCKSGKRSTIDCYAATSPAEFFAVMSEVFFECPDIVNKQYSAIYTQLCEYYRQDPMEML